MRKLARDSERECSALAVWPSVMRQCHIFFRMERHRSARIGRTLFALTAVWCLGCNSFDILADQLSASTVTTCNETAGTSLTTETGMPSVDVSLSGSDMSVMSGNCGCAHCVGVEPVMFAVGVPDRAVREVFRNIIESPLRISTEPAVPPPQARFIA